MASVVPVSNPAIEFFGGFLLEAFVACGLYGVATLQTFYYFQSYKDDSTLMKSWVATIWVMETAHTAFCMLFTYMYLIQNFGVFAYFEEIHWSGGITVLLECFVAVLVQAFYVRRVWIMSKKSIFLSGIIASLVLIRLGFGIASTVFSYQYPEWIPLRATKECLASVSGGLGAAVLTDVLVALTLSYYLSKGRNRWHKESNNNINKIIAYAVNTGAVICIASIAAVILYALQDSSLNFLGLVNIQGKLYAISFIGSLNARSFLQNKSGQYPSADTYRSNPGGNRVEVYRHTVVTSDMKMESSQELAVNEYNMQNLKLSSELV